MDVLVCTSKEELCTLHEHLVPNFRCLALNAASFSSVPHVPHC